MKEELLNILILKHLKGTSSPEEKAQVEAWLKQNKKLNSAHYHQISRIFQAAGEVDFGLNTDTCVEWEKLKAALSLAEAKTGREAKVVSMQKPFSFLLKVAAVLVLTIGLGWFFKEQLFPGPGEMAKEFVVPKGKIETVTLADGSIIRLNADSKLTVAAGFNAKNRQLTLEGEGYFEVAKNAKIPFVIQTGNVKTTVVGTVFNLKAYPETESIRLTVIEGKVRFEKHNKGLLLEANKAAAYQKTTASFKEESFDKEKALGWQRGKLVFDNIPFSEAIRMIERRYNLVVTDRSGSGDRRVKITFDTSEKAEAILRDLGLLLGLKLTIKQEIYTFSK